MNIYHSALFLGQVLSIFWFQMCAHPYLQLLLWFVVWYLQMNAGTLKLFASCLSQSVSKSLSHPLVLYCTVTDNGLSLVSLGLLSLTYLLISFSQKHFFFCICKLTLPPLSHNLPSLPHHRVRPVGGRTWRSFWAMPTSHPRTPWPCTAGLYQAWLREVRWPVWPPDPTTGRTAPPVASACSSVPHLER